MPAWCSTLRPPNQLRQDAIERSAPHQSYVAAQCQRENLAPAVLAPAFMPAPMPAISPPEEAPLLVRSLLSAGLDTTVNGIGAAIYCLARFPDQLARLRKRSDAGAQCVRRGNPLRKPGADFLPHHDAGGRTRRPSHRRRREGADVPRRRQPRSAALGKHLNSYDVTRRTSGHVGFGSGIHMCVGQLLARVEGEVMLAAIARKVASIEITGPVKRRFNNTLRGLESLPITISPA